MLRSTTLMLSALLCASPVAAAGPTLISKSLFEGQEFEFASRLDQDGKLLIDGWFVGGAQQFRLSVDQQGRVEGALGRTPVEFVISREERELLVRQAEIAVRS